jgi:16S rRNA (cytosine967-C5)-methyltransferase
MKPSSLLGHASEALTIIRDGHRPADVLLADFFRERRYLGARDRRSISEMVYGTLRNARLLEFIVRRALDDAFVLEGLLPSGMSSLLVTAWWMHVAGMKGEDGIAAAGEHLSTMQAAGIPNAFAQVLEQTDISHDSFASPLSRIATMHSFPDSIIEEWISLWGPDATEALAIALNQQAPLSIRVNTLKRTVDQCRAELAGSGVETEKGRVSPFALVLPKRLSLESLRPYRDGLFEMQDEGSQLLALLVDPQPGTTVVDACAGGGGKTLHLAAMMGNRGRLVAIDVDNRKLQSLQERAARAGAEVHMILTAERDASTITRLRGKAHGVLVDAPCSAIGTVRRNPSLKMTYTNDRSQQLCELQKRILESSSALVMPGGRLVYSTCTLLQSENEQVVDWFRKRHPEFELQSAGEILSRWGIHIDRASPYLQLHPNFFGTDGFFAAVLVREGSPA